MLNNPGEGSKAAQQRYLWALIKPHFLFNSLNVIAALCRIDSEKARKLILDLYAYLRYIFDFCPPFKFLPFAVELELIQAYVRIEKARFPNKLEVHYELDNTDGLMLPPYVLQPLVENAIRHGIRKTERAGTVVLCVNNEPGRFVIRVEDDGVGITGEHREEILKGTWKSRAGIGIANINRRLQELYGTTLDIQSSPGKGTVVTVFIPKNKT
jgi:LytS/YehU family sensor histidine kinase